MLKKVKAWIIRRLGGYTREETERMVREEYDRQYVRRRAEAGTEKLSAEYPVSAKEMLCISPGGWLALEAAVRRKLEEELLRKLEANDLIRWQTKVYEDGSTTYTMEILVTGLGTVERRGTDEIHTDQPAEDAGRGGALGCEDTGGKAGDWADAPAAGKLRRREQGGASCPVRGAGNPQAAQLDQSCVQKRK